MDEREHPHLRLGGQLCGLAGSRVARLVRSLGFLVGEARLVDEELGLVRGHERELAGLGVAGDDDLAPAAGLADHLRGLDAVHALARLEAREVGAGLDARGASASSGSNRPGRSSSTSA